MTDLYARTAVTSPAQHTPAVTVPGRATAGPHPTISMIVCTRNRGVRLPEFFAHLSRIDFPERAWELVIVDHASTDDTSAVIRAFAARTPVHVCQLRAS